AGARIRERAIPLKRLHRVPALLRRFWAAWRCCGSVLHWTAARGPLSQACAYRCLLLRAICFLALSARDAVLPGPVLEPAVALVPNGCGAFTADALTPTTKARARSSGCDIAGLITQKQRRPIRPPCIKLS